MIAGLLFGGGVGAGVVVLRRALSTRPVPLRDALADLHRPGRPLTGQRSATTRGATWEGRAAARSAGVLAAFGVDLDRRTRDLRVTGRTAERLALDKIAGALSGVGVPVLMAGLARAGGAQPPVGAVAGAALACAVAGFLVPDVLLRQSARQAREAFRHALSAYLDLVNVLLAGSAGVETALHAAARAGDGAGFSALRGALERARALRQSPWEAFDELGEETGVAELVELAATVRLAGQQGARIKASLAARAAALRARQLAHAEAAAIAASERMALPNVLMFIGFIVFVGYPAIAEILGS